jgi:hypothetical protein
VAGHGKPKARDGAACDQGLARRTGKRAQDPDRSPSHGRAPDPDREGEGDRRAELRAQATENPASVSVEVEREREHHDGKTRGWSGTRRSAPTRRSRPFARTQAGTEFARLLILGSALGAVAAIDLVCVAAHPLLHVSRHGKMRNVGVGARGPGTLRAP